MYMPNNRHSISKYLHLFPPKEDEKKGVDLVAQVLIFFSSLGKRRRRRIGLFRRRRKKEWATQHAEAAANFRLSQTMNSLQSTRRERDFGLNTFTTPRATATFAYYTFTRIMAMSLFEP